MWNVSGAIFRFRKWWKFSCEVFLERNVIFRKDLCRLQRRHYCRQSTRFVFTLHHLLASRYFVFFDIITSLIFYKCCLLDFLLIFEKNFNFKAHLSELHDDGHTTSTDWEVARFSDMIRFYFVKFSFKNQAKTLLAFSAVDRKMTASWKELWTSEVNARYGHGTGANWETHHRLMLRKHLSSSCSITWWNCLWEFQVAELFMHEIFSLMSHFNLNNAITSQISHVMKFFLIFCPTFSDQ